VTAFNVEMLDIGARSPFNASTDAGAWSRFDDSPAATRKAPSSLRSNPKVRDS
jgi:hypothetical protein